MLQYNSMLDSKIARNSESERGRRKVQGCPSARMWSRFNNKLSHDPGKRMKKLWKYMRIGQMMVKSRHQALAMLRSEEIELKRKGEREKKHKKWREEAVKAHTVLGQAYANVVSYEDDFQTGKHHLPYKPRKRHRKAKTDEQQS